MCLFFPSDVEANTGDQVVMSFIAIYRTSNRINIVNIEREENFRGDFARWGGSTMVASCEQQRPAAAGNNVNKSIIFRKTEKRLIHRHQYCKNNPHTYMIYCNILNNVVLPL